MYSKVVHTSGANGLLNFGGISGYDACVPVQVCRECYTGGSECVVTARSHERYTSDTLLKEGGWT